MLFEKEKYYKYIGTLEKLVNFLYLIFIILGFLIGCLGKTKGAIIGGLIGFALASYYTLGVKIKIQEMKWKMDIHENIKKYTNIK